MDISPSDTLQFRNARDNDDERHICPLQLDVIRRGVQLWSNPGDVVLSTFMGIGSEGHVALELGRAFIGFELKPSYYACAVGNLRVAEKASAVPTLFDAVAQGPTTAPLGPTTTSGCLSPSARAGARSATARPVRACA